MERRSERRGVSQTQTARTLQKNFAAYSEVFVLPMGGAVALRWLALLNEFALNHRRIFVKSAQILKSAVITMIS